MRIVTSFLVMNYLCSHFIVSLISRGVSSLLQAAALQELPKTRCVCLLHSNTRCRPSYRVYPGLLISVAIQQQGNENTTHTHMLVG